MNCRTAELPPHSANTGRSGDPGLPNCRTGAPQGRLALAQHEVLGSLSKGDPVPQGRLASLRTVIELLLATLREIFDENAYARFLQRHALAPSRAAYDQFLRENARARERRPRCC